MSDALRFRFPDGELVDHVALGDVTDRSVRAWFRRSMPGPTVLRLRVADEVVAEMTASADEDADNIGVAVLATAAPRPDEPFVVECGVLRREGRFAPTANSPSAFTFAFGSCHQPFKGPDEQGRIRAHDGAGIYPLMRGRLVADAARFQLLVGDQVYSDGLGEASARTRLEADDTITDAELVETYRHLYRGYFNEPGFRSVLEAIPAYLTWDDHDIFDGWGSQMRPSDLDRRLYRAAETAYIEYQHLRNPGAGMTDRPPFDYHFWYGDVGFFVLDLRGCRDYRAGRVLGDEQWASLDTFFAEAAARGCRTVFLAAGVPVVHFSPLIANSLDWVPGSKGTDVRDRWSVAAFAPDREALLDRIFAWQQGGPKRQVAVLSGDVHVATAFRVHPRRGPGELIQWVSSALSTPGGLGHTLVNRIGTTLVNVGEGRTHADRRGFAARNNFGTVTVRPLPDGGHALAFTVHEHDPRHRRLRQAFTDSAVPG